MLLLKTFSTLGKKGIYKGDNKKGLSVSFHMKYEQANKQTNPLSLLDVSKLHTKRGQSRPFNSFIYLSPTSPLGQTFYKSAFLKTEEKGDLFH